MKRSPAADGRALPRSGHSSRPGEAGIEKHPSLHVFKSANTCVCSSRRTCERDRGGEGGGRLASWRAGSCFPRVLFACRFDLSAVLSRHVLAPVRQVVRVRRTAVARPCGCGRTELVRLCFCAAWIPGTPLHTRHMLPVPTTRKAPWAARRCRSAGTGSRWPGHQIRRSVVSSASPPIPTVLMPCSGQDALCLWHAGEMSLASAYAANLHQHSKEDRRRGRSE